MIATADATPEAACRGVVGDILLRPERVKREDSSFLEVRTVARCSSLVVCWSLLGGQVAKQH